jgi:competence/damage-inducible protein CinA-like protein
MPCAEIITIGTELLLGEIVDTNTPAIARALRGLGIDLYRTTTIGDNTNRIAEAVRQAVQRADIVITTGGLGPTVDDPTREALAQATGVENEFRPELWEQVTARLLRFGRRPGENQKRQAYIPCGAIPIENPVGTAPAFIIESERNAIIALPGVPREMETLLHEAVIPYLQKRYNLHEIIKVRLLHTSGVGESLIDEKIGDFERLANPTVGLAAHAGIVDVRIAAKAGSVGKADAMIAKVETQIRQRLGEAIFGADEDTLEGKALDALLHRGWNLVAVESGLDGALMQRLAGTQHPAWLGGETLENLNGTKLLDALHAARQARHASTALGVRLTIEGEQQNIHIVLISPQGMKERRLTYGGHPKNAPRWAANMALDWLRLIAGEGK